MSRNYSYKQGSSHDDTALYMRDYYASIRTKKILARLSLLLLAILFSMGFLLSDYIGEELAAIMLVAPVILMCVWLLVVWFYKAEPPPFLDPPVDINAEFGKQYFQSRETIEQEEALSRVSKLPQNASINDSVVKVID